MDVTTAPSRVGQAGCMRHGTSGAGRMGSAWEGVCTGAAGAMGGQAEWWQTLWWSGFSWQGCGGHSVEEAVCVEGGGWQS